MSTCGAVLLSALSATALGQEPEMPPASEPKTKLEAFLATTGRMVVKDFYEVGMLAGTGQVLKLEAVSIYEPGRENNKQRGLRIEITEHGRLKRSHTSFLDLEELDAFASAVVYMRKLSGEWQALKREPYTEVVFGTKGDFKFGFYQKPGEQQMFASSGVVGRTSFFGVMSDLPRLHELLTQAQTRLKAM